MCVQHILLPKGPPSLLVSALRQDAESAGRFSCLQPPQPIAVGRVSTVAGSEGGHFPKWPPLLPAPAWHLHSQSQNKARHSGRSSRLHPEQSENDCYNIAAWRHRIIAITSGQPDGTAAAGGVTSPQLYQWGRTTGSDGSSHGMEHSG